MSLAESQSNGEAGVVNLKTEKAHMNGTLNDTANGCENGNEHVSSKYFLFNDLWCLCPENFLVVITNLNLLIFYIYRNNSNSYN